MSGTPLTQGSSNPPVVVPGTPLTQGLNPQPFPVLAPSAPIANETFVVSFSRGAGQAAPYLSGTYTLDTNNRGGDDALVFRATDIFNGSTSFFFPQFELVNRNEQWRTEWSAYDQRANPFRVQWDTYAPPVPPPLTQTGDSVRWEVLMTPSGGGTALLAAQAELAGTFISTSGFRSTGTTGAIFVSERVREYNGYTNFVTDEDRRLLGTFYVNQSIDNMLSTSPLMSTYDGENVGSLAAGGFDRFIFNTVKEASGLFNSDPSLRALEADIKVDNLALEGGRKFLNLAGSLGSATPNNPRTNFTSVIPDVEYNLSVDLDGRSGITVRETDTGARNWWDEVAYSDLGILADGRTGLVNNNRSASSNFGNGPVPSAAVTLTTGYFTALGDALTSVNVSSVNTSTNFITLSSGHGFRQGDILVFTQDAQSTGPLNSGVRYVVTEVSDNGNGNGIKVAPQSSPTSLLTFPPGYTVPAGGSFQKLSDYDVTVLRTNGAKDVYAGFESYILTTDNDTIHYKGGNLSINAGSNNRSIGPNELGNLGDLWRIEVNDLKDGQAPNDLRIASGSTFAGETRGLFVNLSGDGVRRWEAVNLNLNSGASSTAGEWIGQMSDGYGGIDDFIVSSGAGYSDDVRLRFDTTTFADRLFLAADGMGTFAEYRIDASAGHDQYFMSSATSPRMLAPVTPITSTNLAGLMGGSGSAFMEEASRFFDSSSYKISFATTGIGGSQKLVATLLDVAQISNAAASGVITVSDTSDWRVGDTVIYRAGAGTQGVTGLTDGMRYTVSDVTAGSVRLLTTGGTPVNPITSADTATSGSSLERIVSTSGVVDGFYNLGAVNGGYVTFADDPGQFSRLSIRVDGMITDQTVLSFNAQANVQKFTAGQDFRTHDLATSQGHATFSIDYGNLYDNQPLSVARTGILYVNGIVDKRALGFDRLVDYSESAYVGARTYSMTEYDDVLVQSLGTSALELTLTAGEGRDRVFVEGVSSDVNQRIEINLGTWQKPDEDYDVLEIGVSKLAQRYGSVQYIDVIRADSSDLIRFVDAQGYTLQKVAVAGSTAGTFKNYATYNIYQGGSTISDNLVMQVRVTGDSHFFGGDQFSNLSESNTNWGQITNSARTISANPSPVSMTGNADSALLFEDASAAPYLMGAGNDYVVTMGGDQDIALGDGDDFLSIRNTGQQLFVSGGAGNDTVGLSGSWTTLSDGTHVSDQWSFSSIEVGRAREFIAEKHPSLSTTTDPFAWNTGPLDRVMVATNRLDGTTVYFQAERVSFGGVGASVETTMFLPPISETYDTTARSMGNTTLYGRLTNDTINLKVADVDLALSHIGSWLNSTNVAPIQSGTLLVGSHVLEIMAQTASGPQWFTGSSGLTNGGFRLVDIENIRLFDNAGKEVTVRVAGSSGYESVSQAVQFANRGDVIFVAETREGALAGTTRAAVDMDTTVSVSGGLRVAFEEGSNRSPANANVQLTVNMNGQVKTSTLDSGFFGTSANALEVLGSANINVNGSWRSDLIVGNRGNNVINGLSGDDVVFGGNGSDMLIGGIGDDVLVGGSSHRIAAVQHTPDEGPFTRFDLSSNAARFNEAASLEFQTGDKVIYRSSGGSGISAAGIGVLTEATPLFVIRGNSNQDGVEIRLASSLANARAGNALDITSNGTATTHGFTLDNAAYTAANLAGSDYLYGGSGNDQLVATGVTGSLSAANVRDTLTMNGGSGNDTFSLFGNSGRINMFGGSGADKVEVFDNFMDVVGVNKSARMVDFAAAQDDILSTFNASNLGTLSVEARLSNGGLALSQLVSPPLPIVSGSGENGNYQQTSGAVIRTDMVEIDGYTLSIADLINLHQLHAG